MKKNVFSLDGPFYHFLKVASDLVFANIIFVISCLPIITIGPAFSALYDVLYAVACEEEPSVFSFYWKSFRRHAKLSFPFGLGFLVWIVVILMDFYLAVSCMTGILQKMMFLVCGAMIFILLFLHQWIWLGIARNEGKEVFSFVVFWGIKKWYFTLIMVIINLFPLLLPFVFWSNLRYLFPTYIFIAFSLPVYACMLMMKHILQNGDNENGSGTE